MVIPFYIDTRYPVHWPTHYDKETATNAMKSAKKIRDWIKNVLK
jgi:HEPN domain-containing protein